MLRPRRRTAPQSPFAFSDLLRSNSGQKLDTRPDLLRDASMPELTLTPLAQHARKRTTKAVREHGSRRERLSLSGWSRACAQSPSTTGPYKNVCGQGKGWVTDF